MKKTIVLIVALLMVFSIVLSGCSKPSDAETSQPQGSQPQVTDTAPKPKQVMKAMLIGSVSDAPQVEVFQAAVDKFNADNPYNVEFQFETYENEQYKTKLATVMASNSAPDVFFTWSSGYLKPFVEGGKVYEIGRFLNADSEWKDRFVDGVFGPVTYDGKIYAVPQAQTVNVMYYNTKLFAENNIAVPKTYDELVQVCQKLKAAGITPISVPVKDAWIAGQLLQQLANGVGGMDLFEGTVDGSVKWNDPKYIQAGGLLSNLVNIGAFQDGCLGMTYDEGRELFIQQKTAMFYMGCWDVDMFVNADTGIAENIGVFNIPASDPTTGNVAMGDVDLCFAISANSANPEAAAALIKLLSDVDSQEAYAYKANFVPSTKITLDESKMSKLFIEINNLKQGFTGLTPWFDRVFGAGEGVEFNNAAQAIMAGKDPMERMNALQQFAEDNATR